MVMLDNSRFKREHQSFDSLHAHAGQDLINDEYIIYNEDSCRIKYFLEFLSSVTLSIYSIRRASLQVEATSATNILCPEYI